MAIAPDKTVLVVGGGISGLTATVETAEAGTKVVLVEKNPYLGGRVAQLYRYFPKLCPPYCGLEINFRRIKQNPAITFYTLAEVDNISGSAGNFSVTIKQKPRYVNEKCTACGECVEACPVERPNEFNFGMDNTKAIYLPHELAFPMRYVIDDSYCKGKECAKCVEACKYGAIDLDMKEKTFEVNVEAIIFATGWNPYDATKMDNLGFGKVRNVITNMMMERLAAPNGPTKGKIVRPSDGKEVQKIAFVQCAGSRDENHLNYCSAICCMASLKQATYIREQNPDAEVTIFYIDLRAPGKYEDFYRKVEADEKIKMIKGKVAKIEEDPSTGDPVVTVEDVANLKKIVESFDMVVLATGMEPQTRRNKLPGNVEYEENGFLKVDQPDGVFATGVATRPLDVNTSNQDATAKAIKCIQTLVGGK
jgi:quinone-modifying oxidoreductase subunit QmoA